MKKTMTALALIWAACCAAADAPHSDAQRFDPRTVKPQAHYGTVAKRVAAMLTRNHVLQKDLNDEVSQKAWTNLLSNYDYSRAVFLKSDLDRFAYMKDRIDDALRAGEVGFAYEVYRTFAWRLEDRFNFVSNLLATTTFDFSEKEDYLYQRKDEPWPATQEEQNEIWRKRVKNEYLALVLGRELDAEQEAGDKAKEKKGKKGKKGKTDVAAEKKGAAPAATNDVAEAEEPPLPPKEALMRRYRQYLMLMTEPDEETVLQRFLSAVAMAYDPHTDYMSPVRKEDFDMDMSLSLCGVGATLSMDVDSGGLKIVDVLPGGPMARDGHIKKGDVIVGVGQGSGPIEDVLFKPMKKTIKKIRGPKDTLVVLEVQKGSNGTTRRRVPIVRDEIKLDEQAVTGRVETVSLGGVTNRFGYVKVPSFYGGANLGDSNARSCSQDVARYLAQFKARETDGLALDLRGNGGGSLPEAVLLAQLFIRPGPVVLVRGISNNGFGRREFCEPLSTFSQVPSLVYRKPMIVLTDRLSASASEIVAGVLQDVGRALIVGDDRTHGKGTVQTVIPVKGGEEYGSMKITTARFYRVNGRSTQCDGVSADVHLPSVLEGFDTGEYKLPNALPGSRINPMDYSTIWNLGAYAGELNRRSAARRAASAAWTRHLKAVEGFKGVTARKVIPLDRARRLKLLREEREMREIEEAEAEEADESAEESVLLQAEDGKPKKDDVVLDEGFRVLADLVQLVNGGEVNRRTAERLPAWRRQLMRELEKP